MAKAKATKATAPAAAAAKTTVKDASTKAKSVPAKTKEVEKGAVEVKDATLDTPATDNEVVDGGLQESFTDFYTRFTQLVSQLSALKTEFRGLEKRAMKEIKVAQKVTNRRKRKTGNRSPSGFVKPTLISNELAAFLKVAPGTELARTEVTREINGYIREHKLQDKDNGRKINPDPALATLLKLDVAKDTLTYFNLQRYMSPHFAKKAQLETA